MTTEQFNLILYDMFQEDICFPPLRGKFKKEFKTMSYSKWAIEELKSFVAHKFYPCTNGTIEEFCEYVTEFTDKMFEYAGLSPNPNSSFIFQTASDVGADVLDLLEAMKGENK
jgi:hypothetical protein